MNKSIFSVTSFLLLLFPLLCFAEPDLDGSWLSKCEKMKKRHSFISTAKFSGHLLESNIVLYSDKECASRNLTVTYQCEIATQSIAGEFAKITFIPNSVKLEIQKPEVVQYYNENKICGFSDWKLNEAKDVNGLACEPLQMPKYGEKVFDVYSVQSNSLQFGSFPTDWSATKRNERPAKLHSIVFQKAP